MRTPLAPHRFLLAEDVFISYSRSDAATYAAALANALGESGFSCFLDQWETMPGAQIPAGVIRALRRSSTLVIVGTPGAVSSRAVATEVSLFLETGRAVAPIDVDGALTTATWFGNLACAIAAGWRTRRAQGHPFSSPYAPRSGDPRGDRHDRNR